MSTQETFHDRCQGLIARGTPFVTVILTEREGSVPQNVGSKMIVTTAGLEMGTVGGGRIEARAIQHAQAMIDAGQHCDLVHWNLNTDIGMTCGGRLRLFFESYLPLSWPIAVFGAGHIAQALTRLLCTLPCQVCCIDSRPEWLNRLPESIKRVHLDSPAEYVDRLDEATFVVSMTQGHSFDLPILVRIYQSERRFPFVGVIGSKSKAAALRRELRMAGVADAKINFHCPVGLPIGSHHPGEIAVSIAAQLLQRRDQLSHPTPDSRFG